MDYGQVKRCINLILINKEKLPSKEMVQTEFTGLYGRMI